MGSASFETIFKLTRQSDGKLKLAMTIVICREAAVHSCS